MQELKLNIKGMHCASCEELIIGILEEIPWIKSIEISSEKGKGSMEIDPLLISEEEIISIINKGGYKATILDGANSATPKKGFIGKVFGK